MIFDIINIIESYWDIFLILLCNVITSCTNGYLFLIIVFIQTTHAWIACTLNWPSLVFVNNLMQFLIFPHVKDFDIIIKTDQFINCCICVTTLFSFCAFLFICKLMQLCIIWLQKFNHIPIISIIIIIIILLL